MWLKCVSISIKNHAKRLFWTNHADHCHTWHNILIRSHDEIPSDMRCIFITSHFYFAFIGIIYLTISLLLNRWTHLCSICLAIASFSFSHFLFALSSSLCSRSSTTCVHANNGHLFYRLNGICSATTSIANRAVARQHWTLQKNEDDEREPAKKQELGEMSFSFRFFVPSKNFRQFLQ